VRHSRPVPATEMPLAAGRLLVARPELTDPNFAHAVVLLLEHGSDGAVGVVLNRPTAIGVSDVLPDVAAGSPGDPVVFQGGPVGLDAALGVAAAAPGQPGFRPVVDQVGLVDLDVLAGAVPAWLRRLRVFVGYAGWGSGQLEGELGAGAWHVVGAVADDVFTPRPERLWRTVLARQSGPLALLSGWTEDPTLN